jgi:hypothetical protein
VVQSAAGLLTFVENYRHPARKWTAAPTEPPPA